MLKNPKLPLTALACLFVATTSFSQKKQMLGSFIADVEDVHVISIAPDNNPSASLAVLPYAWTQQGEVNIARPLIRFDLSALPDNAMIDEALLVYYYDPFSATTQTDHSTDNGFYVRRVTSNWDEFSVTWNTQPTTTTTNEVYVPPAAYSRQNYVIDVTELIKDILVDTVTGNQGFQLQLETESPFRVVVVASSKHPDISRHPQLWLSYSDPLTGTNADELTGDDNKPAFQVFPNPNDGQITLLADQAPKRECTAELFNLEGRLMVQQTIRNSLSFIYTHTLPNGTYVLRIRNAEGYMQEEKVIVLK